MATDATLVRLVVGPPGAAAGGGVLSSVGGAGCGAGFRAGLAVGSEVGLLVMTAGT